LLLFAWPSEVWCPRSANKVINLESHHKS
jgi:hypothetical protein